MGENNFIGKYCTEKKAMNRQLLLGACLLYLLSSTVLAQGPGWHRKLREIVPTVSSAEDVETRFKHAVLERKFVDKGVEALL